MDEPSELGPVAQLVEPRGSGRSALALWSRVAIAGRTCLTTPKTFPYALHAKCWQRLRCPVLQHSLTKVAVRVL